MSNTYFLRLRQSDLVTLVLLGTLTLPFVSCSERPSVKTDYFAFETRRGKSDQDLLEEGARRKITLPAFTSGYGKSAVGAELKEKLVIQEVFRVEVDVQFVPRQTEPNVLIIQLVQRHPDGNDLIIGNGTLRLAKNTNGTAHYSGACSAPNRVGTSALRIVGPKGTLFTCPVTVNVLE